MKRLPSESSSSSSEGGPDLAPAGTRKLTKEQDDKLYFEAYNHIEIHEEMIRDHSRTNTYRLAMLNNPSNFKDKVVLDVGCGTGILSLFAAQAGAKKVYAIDASSIIEEAKKIVEMNKMEDKITLIKSKIEDVELPEKVDVIISEWMGYFLLYESMLLSVLYARDKWLKEGGILFPSEANLYVSLFEDDRFFADHVSFWKNVYGFDFSPLIPFAKKCNFTEPQVECICATAELSFPHKFLSIDCMTVEYESVKDFQKQFSFKTIGSGKASGFCTFFDVAFKGKDKTYTLSTSPSAKPTHWRQSLFLFEEPIQVEQDSIVDCTIIVSPHYESSRALQINFEGTINNTKIQKQFFIR